MTQPAILRKLVIFGVPLVLGLIETAHPALWPNDPIFPIVHAIATWWTVLHVLQVPLFALLGFAVLFLIEELKSPFATISRYSIILFIVVYPAFDAAYVDDAQLKQPDGLHPTAAGIEAVVTHILPKVEALIDRARHRDR